MATTIWIPTPTAAPAAQVRPVIKRFCSYFSILTLSGRFASSSPKRRAFDIIGNFPKTVKTSHFGGGGIASAMTERVSQLILLRLFSITKDAAAGYPEMAF